MLYNLHPLFFIKNLCFFKRINIAHNILKYVRNHTSTFLSLNKLRDTINVFEKNLFLHPLLKTADNFFINIKQNYEVGFYKRANILSLEL